MRNFGRNLALTSLVVALALACGAGPASQAAVFGVDDRGAVPPRHKALSRSIGLFYNAKAKTVCSAFCVGDALIATASHCIFKTAGEAPLDPADFRFGQPHTEPALQARVAGAADGTATRNVIAGNTRLNVKPPIDATEDWALVRLDRPACRGAVLPVEPLPPAEVAMRAKVGQVFHVAFHRDRLPWKLLYAQGCRVAPAFDKVERDQIERDFRTPERLLLHRCGTGGASSGSPLLVEGRNGPAVIGINVGTYVQSRIMLQDGTVTFRSKPEPIANTAVAAQAFVDEIATLNARVRSQTFFSRSSRATSSADSGATVSAIAGEARRLRQSSQPARPTSSSGVPHSKAVERATGGRSSTKVP